MSPMESALYVGTLRHRRNAPVAHVFEYRVTYAWLDLAELEKAFEGRWLWSTRRPSVAWFRRADYLGEPTIPLDVAVRDRAERELGWRPCGPIRMLTLLRMFGHAFNPVTFYYCYGADGHRVEALVVEITNTPWGERHAYALRCSPDGEMRFRFDKAFHVSPFMPMEQRYDWRFTEPGERLCVRMTNLEPSGARVFDATLRLDRREIGTWNLATALVRHPIASLRVLSAIYWQALCLHWKGARFHPHPSTTKGIRT
jgi:DUF1365 family protein